MESYEIITSTESLNKSTICVLGLDTCIQQTSVIVGRARLLETFYNSFEYDLSSVKIISKPILGFLEAAYWTGP
jgi:hypothetical protein